MERCRCGDFAAVWVRTGGGDNRGEGGSRCARRREHKLARVDAVQGRARDKGVRNNELDLNRAAAVINLQEIAKLRRAA